MRKRFSFILLILCSMALVLILHHNLGEKRLSQLYVDEEAWEQLMHDRQAFVSNDPIFHAVYLNGYEPGYDHKDKMLLYSLIENSALADDPPVRVSSTNHNIKVALLGNPISEDLIRKNESIHMMFYSDKDYEIYELKCTTLPIIDIDISPTDIPKENVYTHFTLFDNRENILNRVVDTPLLIHLRGNNSLYYPKKDYRLSLRLRSAGNNLRNNHLSILGMRNDDDWILKSLYNDKDKIREVFSTNLWYASCADHNDFRITNGTQYRYVELFSGGQYCGLYALCHPIDAKQLQLTENEHFYKKDQPHVAEKNINFHSSGKVDGYEYLGSHPESPDWEPLRRYYHILFSSQPDAAHSLYDIADIDNSIDIFLFLNLIQGVDHVFPHKNGSIYNLFLTSKLTSEQQARILYTPWDMDRTWGLTMRDKYNFDASSNLIIESSIVTKLLEFGDQNMAQMVVSRYSELRNSFWSDEAIQSMLFSLESDIFHSGAYARDYARWADHYSNLFLSTVDDAQPHIRYPFSDFIQYVLSRLHHMDSYIDELARKSNL